MADARQRLMDQAIPASLRVGVAGDSQQAVLWALALREYGRHRVVGYRLDPTKLTDPDGRAAWERAEIANWNLNVDPLIRHSQLVYLFPGWPGTVEAARAMREGPGSLVLGSWDLWVYRALCSGPLVYNPVPQADNMDDLITPGSIWAATNDPEALALVQRVWNPITNTTPFLATTFARVSPTGLFLPPSVLDAPAGVSAPPPAQPPTGRL